jgi:hypothetical protein
MSDTDPSKIKVRYEATSAKYANQIVVSANREDIILDFSSGAVPDPVSGDPVLPIHSRIALSWAGAARLRALIDQALERQEKANEPPSSESAETVRRAPAKKAPKRKA